MSDALRARIEAALDSYTHNGHLVDAELGDVLDAVMAVVEKSLWNAANTNYGKCSSCNALVLEGWARPNRPVQPHKMTCRWYVGPLEHRRLRSSYNTFWQKTEYECTCGGTWREGGDGCPNVAETWRGASPEQQDVP
jgi:hypothetical protein